MKQIDQLSINELSDIANNMYGNLVKAAVDIENKILVIDVEMHADAEQFLLEKGSKQENIWGINLYPNNFGTDKFVEFDSLINIRPSQKNMSRNVENEIIRKLILILIKEKIINE